jgi:hypothetical protein
MLSHSQREINSVESGKEKALTQRRREKKKDAEKRYLNRQDAKDAKRAHLPL